MPTIILRCGDTRLPGSLRRERVEQVSQVPTRAELRLLDAAARTALPHDPTPNLEEIAAQPDVAHLGAPAPAPQHPEERLRVVVCGGDAALSATLTRAMRADYLWAEIGFVPDDPASPAATGWGLPESREEAAGLALDGSVRPLPTIRTDRSVVVAGSAVLEHWDARPFVGEIIVDDERLVLSADADQQEGAPTPLVGDFGARLAPMTDAPGIAAVRLRAPWTAPPTAGASPHRGTAFGRTLLRAVGPAGVARLWAAPGTRWLTSGVPRPTRLLDPESLTTGRAVQSGGKRIRITIDGVSAPRPLERVTFYRHLRDLQAVRP